MLVVARLDRLARSMRQLLTTVDTLQARGIGLRSLHENIDTTSATGRLILHIFAALGQFEVELLREHTRTALAASRARGRIGGRPPALDAIKVKAAKAMLASRTMTASEIAQQIGCSASTLYRHVPGGRTAIRVPGWGKALSTAACYHAEQEAFSRAMLHRTASQAVATQFPARFDCEGRTMFASIRGYNVRRGSAEELARRVREGFVPMMRQIQGLLLSA